MTGVTRPAAYRVEWLAAQRDGPSTTSFSTHYPVRLTDGCGLRLPLTPLPGGERAVALLMSNQTPFVVERRIVERLATLVRAAAPDTVVGIPTLGLTYARSVAEAIGLPDFVPLGHSRKFWYDDALSEAALSSTSPGQRKRIYLDPALLSRVQGRRVVVVDDVLTTGATMSSALRLLEKAGATVAAIVAVLTEGWAWHDALARIDPAFPARVHVLGHIPLFRRLGEGWVPVPETDVGARPAAVLAAQKLGVRVRPRRALRSGGAGGRRLRVAGRQ